MDLYEFQKLALRTESVIGDVVVKKDELLCLIEAYAILGDMLDCYKKKIFYKKDKKYDETFLLSLRKIQNLTFDISYAHDAKPELVEHISNDQSRILHGMLGVCTESAELAQILNKFVEDGSLDVVNLMEEMADGAGGTNSWYTAVLCDALNIDPYEPMDKVIRKLRARFPDKYCDELAENRNIEAERAELES